MFGEPKEVVDITGYGEVALDPPAARAYYNEIFGYQKQIEELKNVISRLESNLRSANQKIETWQNLYYETKQRKQELEERLDYAKNDYYKLWAQITPGKYPPKPNW